MPGKTQRSGGKRKGAGRLDQNPHIGLESARSLKVIVLSRGLEYTEGNRTKVLEELIEAEWRKLDEQYQTDAKQGAFVP